MTAEERAALLASMVEEFVAKGLSRDDAEARVRETARDIDVITGSPPKAASTRRHPARP
jgi:hypothetical protein